MMEVHPKVTPPLDPGFRPASLWNQAYREKVRASGEGLPLVIALERDQGRVSLFRTEILPHRGSNIPLNLRYVERLLKTLLWIKGGFKVTLAGGHPDLAGEIRRAYSPGGPRAFDVEMMGGGGFYDPPFQVEHVSLEEAPEENETPLPIGGNLEGCRIGFDLGGSDRKGAALVDGEVVFSEEIPWDPYFQEDPEYHRAGILDTLRRCAARLPRVDAIGGSAAGVYMQNKVRVASLFRGVPKDLFEKKVRNMFLEIQAEWGVPFAVVNDGEVAALAGAMALGKGDVLGISMGTSMAAGYVNKDRRIMGWLDETAFVPVDYREDAPADEWSGDLGCGVQYFSQQAVGRLGPSAGIARPEGESLPRYLVRVQELMAGGDERAAGVYRTIGICFGYALAHLREFIPFRQVLVMGRVTSGEGGKIILDGAAEALRAEFPGILEEIGFHVPDEKTKRHGQAVAAASLPSIKKKADEPSKGGMTWSD